MYEVTRVDEKNDLHQPFFILTMTYLFFLADQVFPEGTELKKNSRRVKMKKWTIEPTKKKKRGRRNRILLRLPDRKCALSMYEDQG